MTDLERGRVLGLVQLIYYYNHILQDPDGLRIHKEMINHYRKTLKTIINLPKEQYELAHYYLSMEKEIND